MADRTNVGTRMFMESAGRLSQVSSKLSEYEVRWRDRQRFLEKKGYMLRPRMRPEWTPSWTHTGQDPAMCEDFERLPLRPNLVDATRISDGRLVYIKRVRTGAEEIGIALMLSEEGLLSEPSNHSVPILDTFQDDQDESISYIVMPFLRLMDDPPFRHVNDVVDFVDQILEGLVFMHNQGVAHRDTARKNLMMDATSMYPDGFHPVQQHFTWDTLKLARVIPRIGVWPPVKYYFVDFGIAVRIPPDVQPKRALGDYGIDREVPELSVTVPYDPFKVDIFIVGNVFRKQICAKFTNVNFLKPLAHSMTARDPTQRPDADDALKHWRKIRGGVCFVRRGALLNPVGEQPVVFDVTAFLKLGILLSRRILMWTARWLALLNRL